MDGGENVKREREDQLFMNLWRLDQGKRADTCGKVAELAWTPGELLCNC
ncbi:hypothetical protein COLO4_38326 [Corchorus olitorius]|uniref:Uncharacterized protein n=1 Tax=Corchorus olitorius TaxID=93759 RepID=A0A1R3FVI3_9ROSI|nr:hypothetical protein COLO4_38326 [Corchorus olitorius]